MLVNNVLEMQDRDKPCILTQIISKSVKKNKYV